MADVRPLHRGQLPVEQIRVKLLFVQVGIHEQVVARQVHLVLLAVAVVDGVLEHNAFDLEPLQKTGVQRIQPVVKIPDGFLQLRFGHRRAVRIAFERTRLIRADAVQCDLRPEILFQIKFGGMKRAQSRRQQYGGKDLFPHIHTSSSVCSSLNGTSA